MKLVYQPRDASDPQETTVADKFHFKAGEPVEMPSGWEHVFHKLAHNPWFKVVDEDPPAEH